jgi:ubiquinone/menaquinone biosynthesis C-methylase UbiE
MNEDSRAYFDKVAASYFQRYYEKVPGGRAARVRQRRVLELLDKPGGKVLDVGCGPGIMVRELTSLGFEFWGVDASPGMIEQCYQNFGMIGHAHFSVGNATSLDFSDEFFDVVICMGVIDRIGEYALATKEMIRVLKRDGTFIIAVPNLLSPWAFWRGFIFNPTVALLRPVYYGLSRKPQKPAMRPFARLHRELAYTRLVAAQDCEITDVVYFNFNLLLSPLDEFFPGLAIWVADKAEWLRFGKLKKLGAGFIVKAKKVDAKVWKCGTETKPERRLQ